MESFLRTDWLIALYFLCSINVLLLSFLLSRKAPDPTKLSFISGTSAKISRKICPYLIIGRIRILPKQGDCIHDKPRIAEAALICSLICNKADKLLCFFLQSLQASRPSCPSALAVSTEQERTGVSSSRYRTQTAVCRLTATLYTASSHALRRKSISSRSGSICSVILFLFTSILIFIPASPSTVFNDLRLSTPTRRLRYAALPRRLLSGRNPDFRPSGKCFYRIFT